MRSATWEPPGPASPWARGLRWMICGLNALALVTAAATAGLVAGGLASLQGTLPSAEELTRYRPRLTTEIYSTELQADGSERHTLLARLYRENREWCPLEQMPLHLLQATVAIEDRPFFRHRGLDPKGIIRAALVNLRAGRIKQGASTITQQVVRLVWLSRERTWTRKLREAILALQVERSFTKQEILEIYLNEVFYGHGAYGVKAAAKLYFGKEPKDLTLAECALLAGLPRWPLGYSPYRYPERAKARRNQVLQAMAEMGFITKQEAVEAAAQPLGVDVRRFQEQGLIQFAAPHFTNLVVRMLCERYGAQAIYEGGLRIYSTLDMRLQKAAEEELTQWVEALRRRRYLRPDLRGQGALVCMTVREGDVVAMVGGVGPYEQVQFNRAAPGPPYYGRQPGSAFKPYVWAAALESGFGPYSVVSTAKADWPQYHWYPEGGHGTYTLTSALAHSINRVSSVLTKEVGIEKVRQYAAVMMDIPISRLRPVPSLCLGTSEVSPLEMVTGYCVFATGGLRPTPRFIRRITDHQGNVLVEFPTHFERVLRPETAVSMIKMMRAVITEGTGRRAYIPYPCAGKTGTTQDARDTWFVGYTPDLCAAVWIGNDDHAPMPGAAYGGTYCAPVWGHFMRRAMALYPLHGQFPTGAGVTASREVRSSSEDEERTVTLCADSHERATPYCPRTYEKTFRPGEPLPRRCHLHRGPAAEEEPQAAPTTQPGPGEERRVTICVDSGQLATPYCPHTAERVYGVGQGPTGVCPLHGPAGAREGGRQQAGSPPPASPTAGPPSSPPAQEGGEQAPPAPPAPAAPAPNGHE
jgi:penicillin-binding protein 1A